MDDDKTKFKEALYRNGMIEQSYSLNEIAKLYKNDRIRFENDIRGYLYCPECHEARLKFNPGHSRQRYYLSTTDKHAKDCSLRCPPVPPTILSQIDKTPDLNNLQTRLENCLYRFLLGRKTVSNPCILYSENDPLPLRVAPKPPLTKEQNQRIPRRRLTHDICQDLPHIFMIYYGKVELEWYENKSERRAEDLYPHKLRIFQDDGMYPICILRFSDNVYKHLSNHIQEYAEEEKRFTALVAFYAKLDGNGRPVGPQDKAPCGATINDSRKIKFLDDTEV